MIDNSCRDDTQQEDIQRDDPEGGLRGVPALMDKIGEWERERGEPETGDKNGTEGESIRGPEDDYQRNDSSEKDHESEDDGDGLHDIDATGIGRERQENTVVDAPCTLFVLAIPTYSVLL